MLYLSLEQVLLDMAHMARTQDTQQVLDLISLDMDHFKDLSYTSVGSMFSSGQPADMDFVYMSSR